MQSPLQFQLGDIVFARCRDSPYWPAKIIKILQEYRIYQVSFFNHNSTAFIEENGLLLLTNETVKSQKKSLINKMRQSKLQNRTRNLIIKGIEMAEKQRMHPRQLIKIQNPSLQEVRTDKEEVQWGEQKKNLLMKEKQLTIELSFEAMNKRKRSPTHYNVDPHPSKKQKLSEEQSIAHHALQDLNKEQKEQEYNMEHIQYQMQKKFSRLIKQEKELKRLQKKNREDLQYLRKSSSEHIDSQIHEIEDRQHEEKDNPIINPGRQEIVVAEEMMLPSYIAEKQAEEMMEVPLVHLEQRPKVQEKSQEVLLEEVSHQSELHLPTFIEPNVQVLVDIKEQSPHEIAQVQEIIRYKQETPQAAVGIAKTEIAVGSCEEIPRPDRQAVSFCEYQIKQPYEQLPVIEEKEQSQQYIKKETANHVDNVQKHEDVPLNKIEQQVLLEYEDHRHADQGGEELHTQMKRQSQDVGSSQQENHSPTSPNQIQNKESSQSHFEAHSLIVQIGSNISNEAENDQAEALQPQRDIPIFERADSQGRQSSYEQIDERIPIARKHQDQSQEQEEKQQHNFPSQQFSQGQDQPAINFNAQPATVDNQMDVQSSQQVQPQLEQVERQECESFHNPLFDVIHKKLEREMDAQGLQAMFDQEFGIPDDYVSIMGNMQKAHLRLMQIPKSLTVQSLRTYSLQIVHYLDGKCDLRDNLLTMTQRQLFLAIITMDSLNISQLYQTGIIEELTYLINLFETSPKKTRSGKYHAEYLMVKARMNYYLFQLANPVKIANNESQVPKIRGEA